jgi:DNA-binding transcriptional ArsR family regulator
MPKLDDRALAALARYFAALAVPMRLRILDTLRAGERNVGELTQATGCTQANVSKHLAVLAQSGLVEKDARGTSVYYRIAHPDVYRLCDIVCGQLGRRYGEDAELRRMLTARAPRPAARKRRKSKPDPK